MLAFLEFVAITIVVFSLLLVVADWIVECRPRWRNIAAFLIGSAAAYAASFSLDLFFGSLFGAYGFKPYVVPVFVWAGYAAGLHSLAQFASASPNPLRFAYLLIGGVAVPGGFVGSHKHSYFVGLSCLAVSLTCFMYPLAGCSQDQRTDPKSITDLMAAAFDGKDEAVLGLLARGADINARDNKGHTALMSAALNGHTRTVQLLLDRGATLDAKDNNGRTALIVAALNGHTETARLLLDRGANANVRDQDGTTPLIATSGDGHAETVKLLLGRGANVGARTVTGRTALHVAAWRGHTETVRLLLAKGADPNAKTNDGATPLAVAEYRRHTEIVSLLRMAGGRE